MKKITILLLIGISLISCSSSSDSEPIPPATEKVISIADTNISQPIFFVNGAGYPNTFFATVKIGDQVRIQSVDNASPTNSYYVKVAIGGKIIEPYYNSGASQQMNWVHTVTIEDFQ